MKLGARSLAALALAGVLALAAPARARPPKKPKPTPVSAPTSARPADATSPATKTPTRPAGPTEVVVVQVAGGRAFLKPGATAGIFRGAHVTLGGKDFIVVQSSDSFAVIDVGEATVREDEKGKATLVDEQVDKPAELPPPQPLATFANAWTPPRPPAESQTPRFVPIGDMETNRRYDVRISVAGGALVPLGQRGITEGSAQLDARVHAEPFQAPVAFDAQAALQDWFASNLDQRAGSSARPVVVVRELLASYRSAGFYGGIGRMRYAASTLGTLDGLKAAVNVGGGFAVGAFGGLLPNPLSAAPSLDAERFGVEGTYRRPDLGMRPEAALVVHGSTFQSNLDERRVSGTFGLYPGPSRLGGHFEVSNFASSNPWGAKAVELTAAGLDTSVRAGPLSFGGRIDVRQPERSLWLGSYLPLSWFCRTRPTAQVAGAPEVCDGSVSTRAYGEVDAAVEAEPVSVLLGATTTGDLTQSNGAARSVGGFGVARIVHIARVLRIDASGNYAQGTYVNTAGGTLGPGLSLLGDALDVSAYYRLTTLQYRSDSTTLIDHGVGAMVLLFPSSVVALALQAEGMTGDDAQALMVFGTATWRPRL